MQRLAFKCKTCGALIPTTEADTHTVWHKSLESVLEWVTQFRKELENEDG